MDKIVTLKNTINKVLNIRKQRKNLYGDSWKELGIRGNYYMIKMKFIRLSHLFKIYKKNKNFHNIKDTLIDLINYAFFMLNLLEEKNDNKNKRRKLK